MTPGESDSLLEVAGLTVRRDSETLLSKVSFSVRRGALHAIVGPNGAGKTTLLSAVLGQIPFAGRIVAHWNQSGRIGYVPQAFHVDRTLPVTVSDFLALTRQQRPVCFGVAASASRRISLLLDRVGLTGFGDRQLSVLSGGELRRVLLANALDPIPELLILDEPSGGLDDTAARWLDDTLLTLKGSVTIVMVSHDFVQLRRVADRVTVLDRRVVVEGPAGDALSDPSALGQLFDLHGRAARL
jgi:zinc transport system ATP-binding protein